MGCCLVTRAQRKPRAGSGAWRGALCGGRRPRRAEAAAATGAGAKALLLALNCTSHQPTEVYSTSSCKLYAPTPRVLQASGAAAPRG